ncbi:hypothetical protein TNCV_300241 [Trichonephila clavipes]|nr:hypothetical protein TNCV_300241 [Trichonephila clavipes]
MAQSRCARRPVHVESLFIVWPRSGGDADWKSQWIKECPPGDKRRSLYDQRVCRLGRCRENGSKEQRHWDKKKSPDANREMWRH